MEGQVKHPSLGYEGDLVLKAMLETLLGPDPQISCQDGPRDMQSCRCTQLQWEPHSSVVLLQLVHSQRTACTALSSALSYAFPAVRKLYHKLLPWKAESSTFWWPAEDNGSVTCICSLQWRGKGAHRTAITSVGVRHAACCRRSKESSLIPLISLFRYFLIERGKNMCGLAACASYPVPLV